MDISLLNQWENRQDSPNKKKQEKPVDKCHRLCYDTEALREAKGAA